MELGDLPHRGLNRRLMATVAVIAGLAVPIVWVALTRTDRSTGDIAFIELRTRDVFSGEPPLVGAYSRYGWSHPGPLMFSVYSAVLAFLLTIVACWFAICGDRWALLVAALAFSLVLQAHIGFGVVLVSNDREDQVFLLYTQLVGALMSDDPPEELQRESAAVSRLEQLRQVPGQRYAMYLVPT